MGRPGWRGTFELDLGADTSSPAIKKNYAWQRASATPFSLTYDDAADQVTFINGPENNRQTLTWTLGGWEASDADAIFLRTSALKSGSSLTLTDLQLQVDALGDDWIAVPSPDSYETPAVLKAAGPHDPETPLLNVLQVTGVDLQQGFTLTGNSTWTWSDSAKPRNSNAAFQIKVGEAVQWRMVEIRESGGQVDFFPVEHLMVSNPAPRIDVTNVQVDNIRFTDDRTAIIADIDIQGIVDSDIADISPDGEADITAAYVYLNGSTEPLTIFGTPTPAAGTSPDPASQPPASAPTGPLGPDPAIDTGFTFTREDRPDSVLHPFDYTGHIDGSIEGVQLDPGWNLLEVTVTDPVTGRTSSSEWSFEVDYDEPDVALATTTVGIRGYELHPDAPDQLDLRIWDLFEGDLLIDELTEDGNETFTFANLDRSVVVQIDPLAYDDTNTEAMGAVVTAPLVNLHNRRVELVENATDSRQFEGTVTDVEESWEFLDYRHADNPRVSLIGELRESGGGEFHPYALQLYGPEDRLMQIDEAVLAGVVHGLVEDQAGFEIRMMAMQGHRDRIAVLWQRQEKAAADAEVRFGEQDLVGEWSEFGKGVVEGIFVDGLWGTVEGAGILLWYASPVYQIYFGIRETEIQIRVYNGDEAAIKESFHYQANQTAQTMARVAEQLADADWDTISKVVMHDDEALQQLSLTDLMVAETVVELVTAIAEEGANVSDRDLGRAVGAVIYEVTETLVSAGAIKLTKAAKLAKVAEVLDTSPRFRALDGAAKSAVARALLNLTDLATTKMCFVAGTAVWTDRGMVNIEDIRAGDLVLARDEESGKQDYREVLHTIITRPDRLFTVEYDVEGLGPIPAAQLVTTAPHPFYVTHRDADGDGDMGGFTSADRLLVGDLLSLADGGTAAITALTILDAAPGETFTTYNLDVAEFDTYFVGDAGVWVHNSSNRYCDKVYGVFRAARKQMRDGRLPNVDPTDFANSPHLTAAEWTAKNLRQAPRDNIAHLYAEAFDSLVEEGSTGWLKYFEGRAIPTKGGGPPSSGHTLSRHVNVDDAALVARRVSEPDHSASRFLDLDTAETAIESALEAKRDWIIEKAIRHTAGTEVPVLVDVEATIGRGLGLTSKGYAATDVMQDLSIVRVLLVFDGAGGWAIKTAYPVPR